VQRETTPLDLYQRLRIETGYAHPAFHPVIGSIMASRRQILKAGMVAGAALVAVRVAWGPFSTQPLLPDDPNFAYKFLGAKERTVLAAIVPLVLKGALPEDLDRRQRAVTEVMRGIDVAVSGLPPSVQGEVEELFALLAFPVTRRAIAGVASPWLEAQPASIRAFLERWRDSRFTLLRSGYRALQELTMAAWYGNPVAWTAIGYPGPPALNR
jgi:hypothetical protein